MVDIFWLVVGGGDILAGGGWWHSLVWPNIKMLYYDRTDVSEGIDINKTSISKVCNICHYSYFLNYSFKFQPDDSNRCHDWCLWTIVILLFKTLKALMVAVLLV